MEIEGITMSKDHFIHDAGKGSRPRDVNRDAYESNFERIFGKKESRQEESTFVCAFCNTLNKLDDVVCKSCGNPAGSYPNDSNRI